MRFCETYKEVMAGTVKPTDNSFEALQEVFSHPVTEKPYRFKKVTCEEIIFEAATEKWENMTGFDTEVRDLISVAVVRDVFPTAIFSEKYGWLLLLSPGTIRNILFARFQQFADNKLAIAKERLENQRRIKEEIKQKAQKRKRTRSRVAEKG